MLTPRQAKVLKILVSEYVASATPVGSEVIFIKYSLGVSPATIRNEMAFLEEEGYITHPHVSAGRIPLEKGYRYFVDDLMGEVELPGVEQQTIRHQFHQIEGEVEKARLLASSILARLAHNISIVTQTQSRPTRLRHVDLVSLSDITILLIVVFRDGELRQQRLILSDPMSSQEMESVSQRLKALFPGLDRAQIRKLVKGVSLSSLEQRIVNVLLRMTAEIDDNRRQEFYFDGLRNILLQPEFNDRARIQQLLEALEQKEIWAEIFAQALEREGVQVFIGLESPQEATRRCSIVLSRYGHPEGSRGVIGVLGPIRMPYDRTVPAVRYLAAMLNELVLAGGSEGYRHPN